MCDSVGRQGLIQAASLRSRAKALLEAAAPNRSKGRGRHRRLGAPRLGERCTLSVSLSARSAMLSKCADWAAGGAASGVKGSPTPWNAGIRVMGRPELAAGRTALLWTPSMRSVSVSTVRPPRAAGVVYSARTDSERQCWQEC